jgi:hypothetical protein
MAYNVNLLSNSQLGPDATITLNACLAGKGKDRSIAQLIANQLRRKVYAYGVPMFFSTNPSAKWPGADPPNRKPVYMLPDGGAKLLCFAPGNEKCE